MIIYEQNIFVSEIKGETYHPGLLHKHLPTGQFLTGLDFQIKPFKQDGKYIFVCLTSIIIYLTFSTKGNILIKSGPTSPNDEDTSQTWEGIVGEDGIISPISMIGTAEENEVDRSSSSVQDNLTETEQVYKEQLEKRQSGESSMLRAKKNIRKRKFEESNEPLDRLVTTCTTIGQNFNTFLNQNLSQNTSDEVDNEDYLLFFR